MRFSSQPLAFAVITLSLITGADATVSASPLKQSWNSDFADTMIAETGRDSLYAQFPQFPSSSDRPRLPFPSGDRDDDDRPRPPFSSDDRDDFEECLDEDDRDDREDCLEDLRDDREDDWDDDDRDDFADDLEDCRDEDDRDDRRDCLEDLRDDRFDDDRDDDDGDGFRPNFSSGDRSPIWRR